MTALAEAARTAIAAAHVARKEKHLAPLRTQLNRAAAMHFQRQKDLLDRRLRDKFAHLNEAVLSEGLAEITAMILTDVFRDTRGAFTTAMQEVIVRAMQGAVRHRCADFNVDIAFNFRDPKVQAALKAYCGKQIATIDETTRRTVAAIIGRGEADGLSYSDIARRIVKRFDEFGDPAPQKHIRNRAELIATYELGQAYESAGRQTMNRLSAKGIPMEKSWLTVGDDRVSALCRSNQDEGWIPLDEAHQSGHQQPCGHPACRCCELYQVAGGDE